MEDCIIPSDLLQPIGGIMGLQEAKIKVRKTIGKVGKAATQDYRNYKYASHDAVTAAVVPAMHKNGITHRVSCEEFQMSGDFAVVLVKVDFLFHHEKENKTESERCAMFSADKLKDGTTMGAIVSYGVKVAMLKYFGLETGEEDMEERQAAGDSKKKGKGPERKVPEAVSGTEKIFAGMKCVKEETLESFMLLVKEIGLTQEDLDARIRKEGKDDIRNLPEATIQGWMEKLDNPF